jgi:hypothetical protein
MENQESKKYKEEKNKTNPMSEEDVKQNPEKGVMQDPYVKPTQSGGENPPNQKDRKAIK